MKTTPPRLVASSSSSLHCVSWCLAAVVAMGLSPAGVGIAAAQSASATLIDNFDRTDGAVGVATTGQPWNVLAGTLSVAGGQAAPGGGFVLAAVNASTATGSVAVRVPVIAGEFWLLVRVANSANYWRFGRWQGQPYTLQQVVQNGLGVPAVEFPVAVVPQDGDTLRCDLLEQGLDCYVNDVLVARTTNNFGAGATAVGLSGYQAMAARFDDLVVMPRPPAPDLVVTLDGPRSTNVGAAATWTAKVANAGAGAVGATELLLQWPAEAGTLTFSGASCLTQGSQYRCSIGSLAPGQNISVFVNSSSLPLAATLVVAASVPGIPGESDLTQNAATLTTVVRAALPINPLVLDTFNRADNAALGTADTGQAWIPLYGAIGIAAGAAAPGAGFSLSNLETGVSSFDIGVTVIDTAPEFWLIVRLVNGGNYWRFGRWQNGAYQLQQVVNSALGSPQVTQVSAPVPAAGDVVSCSTRAAFLECAVNGLPVARTADTFGNGATKVGLSAYQGTASRFEDFVVTLPPPVADISAVVTGAAIGEANSTLAWVVKASNVGAALATDVSMTVVPPPTVSQFVSTDNLCTPQGDTWRCALGSLAPGQVRSLAFSGVAPPEPARIVLNASIPAASGEVHLANNQGQLTTNVRPAGSAVPDLLDSFDRVNAASLGQADSGQTWNAHASGLAIRDGRAAAGAGFALASVDPGTVTQDISLTVVAPATEFWLVMRFEDGQNYWRFGRSNGALYQLQSIRSNAVLTTSVETLGNVTPAAGDTINCRVESSGIACAVNGIDVARTADSAGVVSRRIGLSAYQADELRLDDLMVFGPPPTPDLSVTVRAPVHVMADAQMKVEIDIVNVGRATSQGAVLTVALPSAAPLVTASAGCVAASGQLQCPISALPAGASSTVTVTLLAQQATWLNGSATVSSSSDPSPANNAETWETVVHEAGEAIVDSFDTDGPVLGTTPSLHQWNVLAGNFSTAGGTAYAAAGAIAVVDAGVPYGTVDVVLGADASTAGILFRVVDAQNYFRLGADEYGDYSLRKIVNGVSYPLTFGYVRRFVEPQPGDRIRLIPRPDDGVYVAVNGEQILDFGDQQFMTATKWGMASVAGPAAFDEFAVRLSMEAYPTHDEFNLADGSELQTPTSGSRYRWRPWLGTPWVTVAGRARPTSNSYTYTWVDTSTEGATAQVSIHQAGAGAWLLFRFNELDSTYFRFGSSGGTYRVDFMQHAAVGTMPTQVQTLASRVPAAGDVVTVRQYPDGRVDCLVNGVVTHRFVDAVTNARWTLYGLAAGGTGAAFDSFSVLPYRP